MQQLIGISKRVRGRGEIYQRGDHHEDQSFGSWGYRRQMQRHQHEAEMSITTYVHVNVCAIQDISMD